MNSPAGIAGVAGKWLLAAVFFILPLNTLRPFGEVAVADLLIAILLPIAFFLFVTRFLLKKRFGEFPKWLWLGVLLLLASIALVELVPPLNPGRLIASFDEYGLEEGSSVVVGMRVIFALVAFPVVISVVVDRWATADLLVRLWIAGVSISCAAAVLDVVFGLGIQQALSYQSDHIRGFLVVFPGHATRQVGLTDHPNTLSLTAVMVSPLIMARMKSRRGLVRYGPALVLITLGILVSGARVGVVGLVLAAGFTLLMDERFRNAIRSMSRRAVLAASMVAVVAVALLSVGLLAPPQSTVGELVPSSISRMVRPSEATVSDRERESRIDDTIGYIKERPVLGYGFQWVESSHNAALQMLLAGGILALVGFYLVLFGYLKMGFGLRNRVPPESRDLTVAATISLLVYVISGIVDNHIFERYIYMPAGLILAMYLLQNARPADYSDGTADLKPVANTAKVLE